MKKGFLRKNNFVTISTIMSTTITEKILASHSGKEEVSPGGLVLVSVDLALANDITAPIAIEKVDQFGFTKLADVRKVVLVPDHFTPNKDIKSAQQCKKVREFARRFSIPHYFETGEVGVEHVLLPEQGFVKPGMVIVGADSHTCTYGAIGAFATGMGSTDIAFAWVTGKVWVKVPQSIKVVFSGKLGEYVGGKDLILFLIGQIGVDGALYKALEFHGEVIRSLRMDDRLSLCNMAIEAGAKNGIIPPDDITKEFLKEVLPDEEINVEGLVSDEDAVYERVLEYNVNGLEPLVACPHSPGNVKSISEAEKDNVKIDQVVIGSCTNGRISDLRVAASILRGKKVRKGIRLIVIPGSQKVYLQAMEEGLLKTFVEAGGVVSPPTCGPCLGGHMGILAEGERAISTTNRNFVGRMGHPKSEVYLSNPAVAAASAIKGIIADPRRL